jgi:hypothetical protein
MAEPSTTTAAVTIVAASASINALTLFGVNVGLRPDVLIAGFCGSLVAIVLLNSVPSAGDTWMHMIETTVRRMFVTIASSLTAGYLTPTVLSMVQPSDSSLLSAAFVVGCGAQQALMSIIKKWFGDMHDD